MKPFVGSAMILCCLWLSFDLNSPAQESGSASPAAQRAQSPKDEYSLSTDSKKDKAKSLAVPFSHINHATKNYSVDGKKTIGCVECHHTDQPKVAVRLPFSFVYPADRTTTLTAETVRDPKTPEVHTCRACHAQEGVMPALLYAVPQVVYAGDEDPTALTNEEAYHRNCNSCHDAAAERRRPVKAPTSNECAKCHTGASGGGNFPRVEAGLQRVGVPETERTISQTETTISQRVRQATKEAKTALAAYVQDLAVTKVTQPPPRDSTAAGRDVDAYKARAVSDALVDTKAILLRGLSGEARLEGLRAYVARAFPAPSRLSVFRSRRDDFVERGAADKVLAEAGEVIEAVEASDTEVEITIASTPDDATFRLLSFDDRLVLEVCTNDCPVRLYRGDYKYEVVRDGYKKKRFDLPLMNRAPRLRLKCDMVKAEESKEPTACRESVLSEN